MTQQSTKAVLLLQDGSFFEGQSFGKKGTASGEICFNTGMTGYQEVFTDPSYYGQILIMNNVHIGNYGVKSEDVESDSVKIKGLIARNLEEKYSRYQATKDLNTYLEENNVVAIAGVDTRALVTHIRNKGAMNCIISTEETDIEALKVTLEKVPNMEGLDLSKEVATKEAYTIGNENASLKIAALDFGIKRSIIQCMVDRGAFIKVFPGSTPLSTIKAFNPDGYFLSNGPGDPAAMGYAIETVKEILAENKPVFGICLGHQLLALANDIPTYKMHHGHRGLNHPVNNLITGLSEISTQNHGFAVDPDAIRKNPHVEVTHINLNDGSIEGFRMKEKPVFSVQYHPEATPGPHDSRILFDDFINLIKKHKS